MTNSDFGCLMFLFALCAPWPKKIKLLFLLFDVFLALLTARHGQALAGSGGAQVECAHERVCAHGGRAGHSEVRGGCRNACGEVGRRAGQYSVAIGGRRHCARGRRRRGRMPGPTGGGRCPRRCSSRCRPSAGALGRRSWTSAVHAPLVWARAGGHGRGPGQVLACVTRRRPPPRGRLLVRGPWCGLAY